MVFNNLKQETSLNAILESDVKRLWLPLVIYDNTDQKVTTRLGMEWEWSTSVTVTREGNFTRSSLNTLDEIEIFEGGENTLTMRQTYELQCSFKLEKYSFDRQTCSIQMTSTNMSLL